MAQITLKLPPQSSAAPTINHDRLMNGVAVLAFLGISDVTLWRWLKDPELKFPRPIVVRKYRYWRTSEIEAFLQRQQEPVL